MTLDWDLELWTRPCQLVLTIAIFLVLQIFKDLEYLVHVLIRTIDKKKDKVKNGFCIQYLVYIAK